MNSFIKKSVLGGIMAVTMVTATVPLQRAEAVSMTDLQAQIQALLAQINSLKKVVDSAPATTCSPFLTNLTLGDSGTGVTTLQKFLLSRGHVIPAGATGYYGEQTRSAVAAFQLAQGVSPSAGNFGPLTRAKANALCVPTVVTTPVNNTTPTTTVTTPKDDTKVVLKGEGELEKFQVKNGDDTNLEEGQQNKSVLELSFVGRYGDVKVNRFDLGFSPDLANNEDDPWDTFTEVSVWEGNTRLAKVDGSKKSNWKEDKQISGYTLRMSGLDYLVKENKEVELTVKVTTQKSIKGTDDGEIWNIFVPNNGIRGVDAANANVYLGDTADYVTVSIDKAGSTDELIVKRSDADPDATTFELKDDSKTGFIKVFAFDIDTDDSTHDIELRKLPISLTVSTGTVNTFMRDIRLKALGKTYTKKTITDGVTNNVVFDLSRNDFIIDGGDRITVEVEVEFYKLLPEFENATITSEVNVSSIVAEGASKLTGSKLSGRASSEEHTLSTKGISVKATSVTSTVTAVNGALNDYATYMMELSVTAFGQEVYIPVGVNSAIEYSLKDELGNTIPALGVAILDSNAKLSGDYYRLNKGETKKFTLEVSYQPGVATSLARLQLLGINFANSATAPNQNWRAVPAQHFKSDVKLIVD
ncbi:MAG: peptidoglycan-binding domain-containing protein [Candidatus Paceibacterota bacterium]